MVDRGEQPAGATFNDADLNDARDPGADLQPAANPDRPVSVIQDIHTDDRRPRSTQIPVIAFDLLHSRDPQHQLGAFDAQLSHGRHRRNCPIIANVSDFEIIALEFPTMASADLLLHPVRLRIVKAFLGDRALTTKQLAAELPDVPAASIYRHVALLTGAGVLQVVAERRVRAVTERTYTLRMYAARLQPDEIAAMTLEQHVNAFLAYIAGLLGDFDRYVASEPEHPDKDGAGYSVAGMWLTDAELASYMRDLAAISQPRLANTPGEGRQRRMLYTVMLPAPVAKHATPEPSPPEPKRTRKTRKESS